MTLVPLTKTAVFRYNILVFTANFVLMNRPHTPLINNKIVGLPEHQSQQPPKPKKKHQTWKRIFFFLALIIFLLGGFVVLRATNIAGKIFVGNNTSLYSKISGIIQSQTGGVELIGEKEGQINILLLGIGGPGHDGPYLSDTIILAQLRPADKKVTLTSIPRDFLVNTKEIGQRKINAVFAESYQRTENWDEAGKSIREVVGKISGLTIPYFAVIDFKGFEQTVDLLGGVDVTVDQTFTDYTFPDDKLGYLPAVTFKAGQEKMSGERALIFARSRHALGDEGSDFARSQRQQKIISAVKAKVVELNIVSDASKINKLFSVIGERFHTNLNPGELLKLYSIVKDYGNESLSSINLDPSTGLICDEILETNGAYVLTLCDGQTPEDLKNFFQQVTVTPNLEKSDGKVVVWLADTTVTQKLYKKAENKLSSAGFTVLKVVYGGKPLTQNVVYSVNNKPEAEKYIKEALSATPVSLPPPDVKIDKTKVDLIVILGSE